MTDQPPPPKVGNPPYGQPPGPPPPPPAPAPAPVPTDVARWGMGDVLLGVVFVLVIAVAGVVIGTVLHVVNAGGDLDVDPELLTDSALVIVFGALFQQAAMAGWPGIVSRWKGESAASDWGWRFRWRDVGIGVGVAVVSLIAAAITAAGLATSLDVDMDEIEGNTEFLTDGDRSVLFVAIMIFVTVIGAPISEELFFRGLTLRAVEKRFGVAAGMIVSSLLFTAVHYIGGSGAQTAILFASVGVRGLIFAAVTVMTGRLGPAIVAHGLSNLLVVIIAFAAT